MAEKVDDLYLPNMVLLRILRDTLPERTQVSREARSAISKVASSFILYVTSLASARCEAAKRKTLLASDIMGALQEMQFGHYTDQLNEFVQRYLDQLSQKRKEKRLASTIQSTSETQPETESMTEDGDAVPSESNPDSPTVTTSEAEVIEPFVHETTVDAGESSKADS
ncbi:DNA polymerase epsilon subunit 3 [Fasciola gigantica]|uniref:DNA polymerase epsilon subunit 3 n=1 Tax=Fasciola gigantica TaxID=46835 RepID=A0A504YDR1_FASGI|nr:DNA polymerase epsilon subunit 3 [Fasciola gigantica]